MMLAACPAACTPEDPVVHEVVPPATQPTAPAGGGDAARIDRDSPLPGAELRCRAKSVAKSSAPTWVPTWSRDGTAYADGAILPAGVTRAGETWTCTLVPTDGAPPGPSASVVIGAPGGNVLLVLIDDVGAASIGPPNATPTIDGLIETGLSFSAAYANPLCSATRAALYTGRYGRRYGVASALNFGEDDVDLPDTELTIAEMLSERGWATGLAGKWHLVVHTDDDPPADPFDHGFGWYDGVVANLAVELLPDGVRNDYFNWERSDQGVLSHDTRYVTTAQIDATLAFVGGATEPWFAVLALTGVHEPLHVPPADLASPPVDDSPEALGRAVLEAVDTELGRLLATIDPEVLARTTVIVAGDNGTPAKVSPEEGAGKSSLLEGGVHVPLVINGPAVATHGQTCDALVDLVDLVPTITDLAGIDPVADPPTGSNELDGISLWRYFEHADADPVRTILYDELFEPPGFGPYTDDQRSVRDDRYRLVETLRKVSLYRVAPGEVEGDDLLADGHLNADATAAYDRLAAALAAFDAELAPAR